MKPWLKWTLVVMFGGLLALLSYPMMPIGSLLWPMPPGGELSLSPVQGIGLMGMLLVESAAFGAAIAFLLFGRPLVSRLSKGNRILTALMHLSLVWFTGIWAPHTWAHLHLSEAGHAATLMIDYTFHTSIYLTGAVFLFSLLSLARRHGIAAPPLTRILAVALPVATLLFLAYPSMPLGAILWPPAHLDGPAPTAVQALLYKLDSLMQSITSGLALAYLLHARSILKGLSAETSRPVRWLFYGALWIMGNWAPHVIAHEHYGFHNIDALLVIEYLFHLTQYGLAMLMIPRFMALLRAQGGGRQIGQVA